MGQQQLSSLQVFDNKKDHWPLQNDSFIRLAWAWHDILRNHTMSWDHLVKNVNLRHIASIETVENNHPLYHHKTAA